MIWPSKAKKSLAIKFGAIEINERELIKKCYQPLVFTKI